jgi:hypothetical protein
MKRITPIALVLGLAASAAAVASGCELFTHPGDFEVDAGVPFSGFCNECPAGEEDLARPPCPNGGTGDDGHQYVFASKHLSFGKPSDWTGKNAESFHNGFDRDCSTRPKGTPVLCKLTIPDAGPMPPWEGLPHGIDSSLSQRIFGPLYTAAAAAHQKVDLDAEFSKRDAEGLEGLILTVDGWNGEEDDDHVVFNLYSSPGVSKANGPVRWDGTDVWDLYPDGPGVEDYFRIADAEGYVSKGVIVLDLRPQGDINLRFGSIYNSFRLTVHEVIFAGKITKDKFDGLTMSALADVDSALESVDDAKRVLSACNPLAELYLGANLPPLLIGAADMPSDKANPIDSPCDSISFAFSIDAYGAKLGGKRDAAKEGPDAGCDTP